MIALLLLVLLGYLVLRRRDEWRPPRPWRICMGTRDKECGRILQVGEEGGYTTHTYCPDCAAAFNDEIDRRLAA